LLLELLLNSVLITFFSENLSLSTLYEFCLTREDIKLEELRFEYEIEYENGILVLVCRLGLIRLLSQKYANKISKVDWFIEDSFIVENMSIKM